MIDGTDMSSGRLGSEREHPVRRLDVAGRVLHPHATSFYFVSFGWLVCTCSRNTVRSST